MNNNYNDEANRLIEQVKPFIKKFNEDDDVYEFIFQFLTAHAVVNFKNENFKKYLNSDQIRKNDPTDFGYGFISNEDIRSKFDSIQLKNSNKYNLIKELSTWINEQAEQSGKYGLYPDIYHKTKEFVQTFF